MAEEFQIGLGFRFENVQRAREQDLIAIELSHQEQDRNIGIGLSLRDGAASLIRLMEALRSDGKFPPDVRTLHPSDDGQSTSLALKGMSLETRGEQSYLILTLEDNLRIPFSFPTSMVSEVASVFTELAIKTDPSTSSSHH